MPLGGWASSHCRMARAFLFSSSLISLPRSIVTAESPSGNMEKDGFNDGKLKFFRTGSPGRIHKLIILGSQCIQLFNNQIKIVDLFYYFVRSDPSLIF
jgi:hypothetical protein